MRTKEEFRITNYEFPLFRTYFLLCTLYLALPACQNKEYENEIKRQRVAVFQMFSDIKQSPLKQEDFAVFKGLNYFEIDPNYRIKAQFKRVSNSLPQILKSSSNTDRNYVQIGEITFLWHEQAFQLKAFALNERDPVLFVPFTDLTNGVETYPMGRYLNISLPSSSSFFLDFNWAFNPYCAYNEEYVCVLPPKENFIQAKIEAGEKRFK